MGVFTEKRGVTCLWTNWHNWCSWWVSSSAISVNARMPLQNASKSVLVSDPMLEKYSDVGRIGWMYTKKGICHKISKSILLPSRLWPAVLRGAAPASVHALRFRNVDLRGCRQSRCNWQQTLGSVAVVGPSQYKLEEWRETRGAYHLLLILKVCKATEQGNHVHKGSRVL